MGVLDVLFKDTGAFLRGGITHVALERGPKDLHVIAELHILVFHLNRELRLASFLKAQQVLTVVFLQSFLIGQWLGRDRLVRKEV